MQLPGHHKGRYSMDKDELGLCCKYTKQLRSAPIFVKSSNSSTIMQYTDINRYRRIILVSAMFTNIISFLAAATRAMLIALLLLSVISQDSPMQHSTDQKRTRHSRCMCIYTHYIAYVIQTQSYAYTRLKPTYTTLHTVVQKTHIFRLHFTRLSQQRC